MSHSFKLARDGLEVIRVNDCKLADFQVFGERCSGTNFLEELIPLNFSISSFRNYGWKHGFPTMPAIAPDSLIVVVFREPLSWLRSMYRKPWHTVEKLQEVGFSEFIRMEWRTVVDRRNYFRRYEASGRGEDTVGELLQLDRHPITGVAFKNIMEMRNHKAAGHLGFRFRECNCVLVQHELAAARTEYFVEVLASAFNLRREQPFRQVERHFGEGFQPSSKTRKVRRDEVSDKDRLYIADQLDWQVESMLGYTDGMLRSPSNRDS